MVFRRMIQDWNTRHQHVLPPLHRCREGRRSCTTEYHTWYSSITRHFIVNPDEIIAQYGWTGVHDLRLGNAAGPSRRHVATGRPRGRPLTTAVPPEPGTYYTSVGGAGGDHEQQQQEDQQEDEDHIQGQHDNHFQGQTSGDFTFGGSSNFGPVFTPFHTPSDLGHVFTPFHTPSPYEYQTEQTLPQEQAHEHGTDRGQTSHSSGAAFGGFLDYASMRSPFQTPAPDTQTQHQTQWTQTQMHTQIGSQEEEEPAQDEPLIRRGPRREARHRGRRCGTGGHIGGQH